MSAWPSFIDPRDLAPGDLSPHPDLPENIRLHEIETPDDPLFDLAYKLLVGEFRAAGEIEPRDVLAHRLRLRPDHLVNGCGLNYQLMLLNVDGEWAALRDHTAIVADGEVTVHLSHVLVLPRWRRRGLVSLLRTLPVSGARHAAREAGLPDGVRVTLVCEMEPMDPEDPATRIRRLSYEKAGFLSVPPGHGYMQPDFRHPREIDADPIGPSPVHLDLIFRRVGREKQRRIAGREILANVERLYAMYLAGYEPHHLEPCRRWLEHFRQHCPKRVALVPPTKIS